VQKKKNATNKSFIKPFKENTAIVVTAFKVLKITDAMMMAPGSYTLS